MPALSVLIPIYNVERFLPRCLDSVVGQSLQDLEIICINDGSTDGSLAIIEEYASRDARIRIIDKANSGYGHSMNCGLAAARGDYLAIVESDDFASPRMMEDLLQLAMRHEADIARSEIYTYNTQQDTSTRIHTIDASLCRKVLSIAQEPSLLENATPIWNSIYNLAFLRAHHIEFLETAGASYQDTSFGFKAVASAQRVVLTETPYLHYRIDNAQSSVHQKDKVQLICGEYAEIHRFLEENPAIKNLAQTTTLINEYRAYAWNMTRIARCHQRDFIKLCSEQLREWGREGELTPAFWAGITARSFMVHSRCNRYAARLLMSSPLLFHLLFPLALKLKSWRARS